MRRSAILVFDYEEDPARPKDRRCSALADQDRPGPAVLLRDADRTSNERLSAESYCIKQGLI